METAVWFRHKLLTGIPEHLLSYVFVIHAFSDFPVEVKLKCALEGGRSLVCSKYGSLCRVIYHDIFGVNIIDISLLFITILPWVKK